MRAESINSRPPGGFGAWLPLSGAVVADEPADTGQGETSTFERLLETVETHVREEMEFLSGYRQLAEAIADPVVALLLQLLLEDEQRHHELLRRIALSLRDGLYWSHSMGALPTPPSRLAREPSPELLAALGALRSYSRQERDGAHRLRELARQNGDLYGGVLALLLESMARDSEKHERILRFILERLKARG